MKKGRKVLVFMLIIAVVGGLAAYGIYNASQQEDTSGIPRNAIPVNLEAASRQTITSQVSAKGSVELLDRVMVYPSTQAKVKTLHVRQGDDIKAGDLIVTYDPEILDDYADQLEQAELALKSAELSLASAKIPPTQVELQQAEAAIRQAEKVVTDIQANIKQIELNIAQTRSSLETAEKRAADTETLFIMGVATQVEVDSAKDGVTTIESQLETLELQLQTAQEGIPMAEDNIALAQTQYDTLANKLSDPRTRNQVQALEVSVENSKLTIANIQKNIEEFTHEEYAPASGTVLNLFAAVGNLAVPGQPLMEVADTSFKNMVIRISIPEHDARNIALNQPVEIEGAALGTEVYSGRISKIHPLAEMKNVGTSMETVLTVEVTPDDKNIPLRAGYSIDTTITTNVQEDVLVVPLMSTLSDVEGGTYVYVMAEDHTVQKRYITLGAYASLYVQADGINDDDQIVLNPNAQIQEGVYVRPINPIASVMAQ